MRSMLFLLSQEPLAELTTGVGSEQLIRQAPDASHGRGGVTSAR